MGLGHIIQYYLRYLFTKSIRLQIIRCKIFWKFENSSIKMYFNKQKY